MPIQHASDSVLERMRRPERERTIREKVRRVREAIPDVAIRTTCIVGFPGETDADFERLLDFLEEIQFERVGAFTYSPQEGTRAHAMADDVPDDVKADRLERLLDLQRAVTAERYERFVGKRTRGIVDRRGDRLEARAIWQADDIDGITWLEGDALTGLDRGHDDHRRARTISISSPRSTLWCPARRPRREGPRRCRFSR